MITGGLDVGVYSIKLVIMDDKGVLASRTIRTGARVGTAVNTLLRKTLRELALKEVACIAATGVGRKKVTFARELIPEIVADARGVNWLYPLARTIIDIGAEEVRVIKCDSNGTVLNYSRNTRCAAGAGIFIESMARALEVSLDELGALASSSKENMHISATCAVFAESEVVSLMHSNVTKPDIAHAISETIAIKTASLVREAGAENDIVFIGGLARNQSVVNELKRIIGCEILVPDEPQTVGALGAAIIARGVKS